jgi:hypothetical protein
MKEEVEKVVPFAFLMVQGTTKCLFPSLTGSKDEI